MHLLFRSMGECNVEDVVFAHSGNLQPCKYMFVSLWLFCYKMLGGLLVSRPWLQLKTALAQQGRPQQVCKCTNHILFLVPLHTSVPPAHCTAGRLCLQVMAEPTQIGHRVASYTTYALENLMTDLCGCHIGLSSSTYPPVML